MVVYRRSSKDSFPAGIAKVAYLDDHREGLDEEDYSDEGQKEGNVQDQAEAGHGCA